MLAWCDRGRSGFTLVELLVVMAILAIMAGLAIPGMARLGVFTRQELPRAQREVYTLLRAAQIYAATYRVDTAVVYGLDNWVSPQVNPNNDPWTPAAAWSWQPMQDSLTGQAVRAVRSAAMMYKLPAAHEFDGWVPVPDDAGAFRQFPTGMVLLLQDIYYLDPLYASLRPRFDNDEDHELDKLGMRSLKAYLDGGPLAPEGDPDRGDPVSADFPGHVFTPEGRLDTSADKERVQIHVAPRPDETLDRRLLFPELGTAYNAAEDRTNLVMRTIEIYKSTGRIRGAE